MKAQFRPWQWGNYMITLTKKKKNVPALALAKNNVIEPIQYGENNVATLKINLMASVYDTQQQN